ncbi:HNH endonuclease family protein [Arvimicrobium flavum]|uniref:HNH endonuclease family protein n=1 Tax=Arvimicrobium flavum TaxID=3393320 RepID=UPI00237BEF23|nr:HNH endonuclease family protein [Mesorhizobium shangrilense]
MPEIVFQLERLAYYLFMVRADVNARMSRYADVLDALEPLAEPKPRISVKDRSTGFTLTQAEAFALFNGLDGDVYLATRVVKPILLRLEQASTDGSAIYDYPTISVEHVCPQTLPDNSQWARWFTDPEAHSSRLHTLGNLVLLNFRKNAAARNFEFDIKKNQYFAPGNSCAFTLTNEVRAYSTWTPADIEERQKVALRRLAKDWRLEDVFENWRNSK